MQTALVQKELAGRLLSLLLCPVVKILYIYSLVLCQNFRTLSQLSYYKAKTLAEQFITECKIKYFTQIKYMTESLKSLKSDTVGAGAATTISSINKLIHTKVNRKHFYIPFLYISFFKA